MKGGDIVTLNNISLSDSQIMELKEEFKIKDEKILKKDVSIKINKQFVINTSEELKKANNYDEGLKQTIKTHLKFGNDVMDTEKLIKYSILRDAILIHSFGYRIFISRCMGVSKSGGFSKKENIKKFKDLQPIVEESVKKIPTEILRKYEHEIKSSGINKELLNHISTLFDKEEKIDEPDDSEFKKKLKSKFVGNTFFQKRPEKAFINLFDIFYSKMENVIDTKYGIIAQFNKSEADLDEKAVQSVFPTGLWNRKPKGGDPTDITEYRESKFTLRRILKLIGIMILMIYFIFLLLESYRLLCFQIDRILQARETYLGIFPGEEKQSDQDKNFISYIFTFFKIMHEAIAGNFINMIQKMQTDSTLYERLKDIVYSSASTASNDVFESCSDNYFGCINGFLTGLTREHALDNMNQDFQDQLEIEYITRKNDFKKMLRDTHHEYNSAFTNIITGINGLLFSNVLLLNTFFPKTYTKTFVFASFSLLQSSYMSRDILWRLGFTGSHIVHLLTNPTQYIKDAPTEEPGQQHLAITNEVTFPTLETQRNREEEMNFNNNNNYNPEQIDEFIHEFFDSSEGTWGGNKKIRKRKYTRKMNKTKKKLRRKTRSKK